jgi:hypothetical protein
MMLIPENSRKITALPLYSTGDPARSLTWPQGKCTIKYYIFQRVIAKGDEH